MCLHITLDIWKLNVPSHYSGCVKPKMCLPVTLDMWSIKWPSLCTFKFICNMSPILKFLITVDRHWVKPFSVLLIMLIQCQFVKANAKLSEISPEYMYYHQMRNTLSLHCEANWNTMRFIISSWGFEVFIIDYNYTNTCYVWHIEWLHISDYIF